MPCTLKNNHNYTHIWIQIIPSVILKKKEKLLSVRGTHFLSHK